MPTRDLQMLGKGEEASYLFYNWCGVPMLVNIHCSCGGQTETIEVEPHMGPPIAVQGQCQKCGEYITATVKFVDD